MFLLCAPCRSKISGPERVCMAGTLVQSVHMLPLWYEHVHILHICSPHLVKLWIQQIDKGKGKTSCLWQMYLHSTLARCLNLSKILSNLRITSWLKSSNSDIGHQLRQNRHKSKSTSFFQEKKRFSGGCLLIMEHEKLVTFKAVYSSIYYLTCSCCWCESLLVCNILPVVLRLISAYATLQLMKVIPYVTY